MFDISVQSNALSFYTLSSSRSLSLDALKSPCPCEARVKRPKGTWE